MANLFHQINFAEDENRNNYKSNETLTLIRTELRAYLTYLDK